MTTMGIEYQKYKEQKRSNLAQEYETNRSNLARENETHRTNVTNENIRQGTLDEQIRTNRANEGLKRDTLSETVRHNKQTEQLGSRDATSRAKQADAALIQANVATASQQEQVRSNKADEAERTRSAKAKEALSSIDKLPSGAAEVAALGKYVTEYGGNISGKNKSLVNKYLNSAVLAGYGTKKYNEYINQARDILVKFLK